MGRQQGFQYHFPQVAAAGVIGRCARKMDHKARLKYQNQVLAG